MTIIKWHISGQGYKHLTRFSRFLLFKPAAGTMQRLTLSAASIFVTEGCLYTFILLLFEENHQNRISRAGENFSNDFALFPYMIA